MMNIASMRSWALLLLIPLAGCDTMIATSAVTSSKPEPRVAGGIHSWKWNAPNEATEVVQRRFPLGSSETAMTRELARERFEIGPTEQDGLRHARAKWGGFPCNDRLDIAWRASLEGRIADLKAVFVGECV
jgi:hypothetical protein